MFFQYFSHNSFQAKRSILAVLLTAGLVLSSLALAGFAFAQESDGTDGEAASSQESSAEGESSSSSSSEEGSASSSAESSSESESSESSEYSSEADTESAADSSTSESTTHASEESSEQGSASTSSFEVDHTEQQTASGGQPASTTPETNTETQGDLADQASENTSEEEEAAGADEEDGGAFATTTDVVIVNSTESAPEDPAPAAASASAPAGGASANSGGPSAASGALINTGDAFSAANVINVINTNIIGSEGLLFLLNAFSGLSGDLDVRDLGLTGSSQTPQAPESTEEGQVACSFETCESGDDLTYNNENTVSIVNDVIVRSSTGANSASDNGGDATVLTGDAYATANVINIANSNIIDSNYLLMVVNNFGDWAGDVVFPGIDLFSQLFLGGGFGSGITGSLSVQNNNDAVVDNNVNVGTETGSNEAAGNATSTVLTGNATSSANTINQVNQNLLGVDSFMVLFRIYGNWSGTVANAPEGLSWSETPEGIVLSGNIPWDTLTASGTDPLAQTGTSSALTANGGLGSLDINNNNVASIANNIDVFALTGANRASDNDGNVLIQTGDAFATANTLNVVNTNVIGRNMMLAIFNIFGNWDGDIAFGMPDLWIGGYVETPRGVVGPGDRLTYHYTVTNNGDRTATGVRVTDAFNRAALAFSGSDTGAMILGDGTIGWDIGDLLPGESRELSYFATIGPGLVAGGTLLENIATVAAIEKDDNNEDNTDVIALVAFNKPIGSSIDNTPVTLLPDPVFEITKTNSATGTLKAGVVVDYEVVIKNTGGPAFHSTLVDKIKDENGEVVYEQYWGLDTILPNEEITVTYSAEFDEHTVPGTYTNYAQVKSIGRHESLDPFYGWFANSAVETSSIVIAPREEENTDGNSGSEGTDGTEDGDGEEGDESDGVGGSAADTYVDGDSTANPSGAGGGGIVSRTLALVDATETEGGQATTTGSAAETAGTEEDASADEGTETQEGQSGILGEYDDSAEQAALAEEWEENGEEEDTPSPTDQSASVFRAMSDKIGSPVVFSLLFLILVLATIFIARNHLRSNKF